MKNSNYTNINIKYLRKKKNISQYKMADDLKIAQATIAKWELDERNVTLGWAMKLSEYFDVDVGSFISKNLEEEDKKKDD